MLQGVEHSSWRVKIVDLCLEAGLPGWMLKSYTVLIRTSTCSILE